MAQVSTLHGLVIFTVFTVCMQNFAAAESLIEVRSHQVVRNIETKPIGMNLNYLQDDDRNRRNGARPLKEALAKTGSRFLRYPGGEKSDAYLWSVPPYDKARPTLARTGAWEWPSGDRNFFESDGVTFKQAPLDFDRFMELCQAIDCEPVIVVAYDSIHKAPTPGGTAPSKQQLLETAVEWVRYANIKKGYNIKYWEIGNETYHDGSYNGQTDAATYAQDLRIFSQAMKAVDPTIQIGANGSSSQWWQTVLTQSGSHIDFLAAHTYPAWDWRSYEDYSRSDNHNFASEVENAERAIRQYASPADRDRIGVALTEINAMTWTSNGWENVNDLGHALVVFDMIMQNMQNTSLKFLNYWNTRWINNGSSRPEVHDAFDADNKPLATGKALELSHKFIGDNFVQTSNPSRLPTFASIKEEDGQRVLSVAIVNKHQNSEEIRINIGNFHSQQSAQVWHLSGNGVTDLSPNIHSGSPAQVEQQQVNLRLPGVSLTLIQFREPQQIFEPEERATASDDGSSSGPTSEPSAPEPTPSAPLATSGENLLANSNFGSGMTDWENWGASQVIQDSSSSDGFVLRTGSGQGGAAQDVASRLKPGHNYRLSAQARLDNSQEQAWLGIKLISSSGATVYERNTQINSLNFSTYELDFTQPENVSHAYVYIWKNQGQGHVLTDKLNLHDLSQEPTTTETSGGTTSSDEDISQSEAEESAYADSPPPPQEGGASDDTNETLTSGESPEEIHSDDYYAEISDPVNNQTFRQRQRIEISLSVSDWGQVQSINVYADGQRICSVNQPRDRCRYRLPRKRDASQVRLKAVSNLIDGTRQLSQPVLIYID